MAYLNSSLLHVRDLEIFCDELIWIDVKVKTESFLIGVFYSPTTSNSQFFNSLNLNIEKAFEFFKNLILVGDLNEDLFNPNFHNLKDLVLINTMINLITEPTRQHAILDQIIIPEEFPFLDSCTAGVLNSISDHKATYIK